MAEVRFRSFLQLAKHFGRDFLRRVLLVADLNLDIFAFATDDRIRNHLLFGLNFGVATSHESLDGVDRATWVSDRLASSWFADDDFVFVGVCHNARRQPVAFCVGNHLHFGTFHDRYDRVGRTEVDADNLFALSHVHFSFKNSVEQCFSCAVCVSVCESVSRLNFANQLSCKARLRLELRQTGNSWIRGLLSCNHRAKAFFALVGRPRLRSLRVVPLLRGLVSCEFFFGCQFDRLRHEGIKRRRTGHDQHEVQPALC